MDRDEKIKVAITAGIMAVILLILVLYLALSGTGKKAGNKNGDDAQDAVEVTADASGLSDLKESTDASKGASDQGDSKSGNSDKAGEGDSKDSANADASSKGSSITGKVVAKKKTISGNSLYRTESAEVKNVYKGLAIDVNTQMNEMAGYWRDGNMDAVRDLAGLERFEAMSYKLNGTQDFFYYGDVNSDGAPNGKGLACYANDQYYYGDWSNGARSGQGTWISFYPDYNQNVVIEHMYVGQWQADLPNGEGQEHYDYDQNYMNDEDIYVQNAIGSFANGLYNGRMYMITVNSNYDTKEWYGDCDNGTWKQVINSKKDQEGRSAVMDEKDNSENHIWLVPEKMSDNGIHGIVTGGKVVKK